MSLIKYVFWSLLSPYFTTTSRGIHSCYLPITKLQKNAVIFYTFRRNMQCGVREATNLLYIRTEKVQELYLNFCTASQQFFYPHSNSFVLLVAVVFYWAGTGRQNVWPVVIMEGIPSLVFHVFSCSNFPWDCQGRNLVPCFLGSNTLVCMELLELRVKMVSSTVPCISYSKKEWQLQVTEWGVNNNLN